MRRIALVTPYHKEPKAVLQRCLNSVAEQRVPADHILVADGHPQDWVAPRVQRHIVLDRAHANYGNTPRAIGALLAIADGYDAIGFLDADNWLQRDHLEHCLETADADDGAALDYVFARRIFRREDGSVLSVTESGDRFEADTNCLLFFPGAYHLLSLWGSMPEQLAIIGDRVVYQAILHAGLRGIRTQRSTVNYLTQFAGAYVLAGEDPPADAKWIDFDAIAAWMDSLGPRAREIAERRAGVPFSKPKLLPL